MEHGRFEDVFPIERGDFPLLCYIVYWRYMVVDILESKLSSEQKPSLFVVV